MADKIIHRGETMLISTSADDDTIYRQAAIDALDCINGTEEVLRSLPSAQPDIIHCKYCKHWKDSDGVYRRGLDAESKCPLNMKEVYEGTFFCGMAKRRE